MNNLTVNEESDWTHAELTMQPRGDALYPQWEVYLPLDRLYPGMVTSIRVTLWADTGDISYIHETTLAGMPQDVSSSSNTAETETPPPTDTSFDNKTQVEKNTDIDYIANVEIIAGVAIMAMMIAVAAVAAKKRKH